MTGLRDLLDTETVMLDVEGEDFSDVRQLHFTSPHTRLAHLIYFFFFLCFCVCFEAGARAVSTNRN
jgi:hypothetical protein